MASFANTIFGMSFLLLLSPSQAEETSGHFPGVYVLEGSRAPSTDIEREALQLKCLLAPGTMHADGRGAGYFLDRDLYRSKGSISYIKGNAYACRYRTETGTETCESKEFSDGKSLYYYRNNVYGVFTSELQRGHSLLSPEDVVAWNSHKTVNPAGRFAYHRCDCLTNDVVEARASSDANELSSQQTGQLLFWRNGDPTRGDLDLARQVLEEIGGCKPNIS